MKIYKIRASSLNELEYPHLRLVHSDWDDWFEYRTTYRLFYHENEDNRKIIGHLKIGSFDAIIPEGKNRFKPSFEDGIEKLPDEFFSLGQDISYYEELNDLGNDTGATILKMLNDIALDDELYQKAKEEDITRQSLLRSVSRISVEQDFRKVAKGQEWLTSYSFTYEYTNRDDEMNPVEFNVIPESNPSSNVHVLIGRNGVGKTHFLEGIVNTILGKDGRKNYGTFINNDGKRGLSGLFTRVVTVSFSAFEKNNPEKNEVGRLNIRYHHIGLKYWKKTKENFDNPDSWEIASKIPDEFEDDFVKSLLACRSTGRILKWKDAIKSLESDTMFERANISELISEENFSFDKKAAKKLFGKLSSGHKIILLTITKLIETVENRTLVLLDEPEAHLHPPLISSFIRALSKILTERNAIAIIATHSPVILQEVPRSCVWKIRRTGQNTIFERPEIETFGENVGILTRDVFGLEVEMSGFHKMIYDACYELKDYKKVLDRFNNQLGFEGRSQASLILSKMNL